MSASPHKSTPALDCRKNFDKCPQAGDQSSSSYSYSEGMLTMPQCDGGSCVSTVSSRISDGQRMNLVDLVALVCIFVLHVILATYPFQPIEILVPDSLSRVACMTAALYRLWFITSDYRTAKATRWPLSPLPWVFFIVATVFSRATPTVQLTWLADALTIYAARILALSYVYRLLRGGSCDRVSVVNAFVSVATSMITEMNVAVDGEPRWNVLPPYITASAFFTPAVTIATQQILTTVLCTCILALILGALFVLGWDSAMHMKASTGLLFGSRPRSTHIIAPKSGQNTKIVTYSDVYDYSPCVLPASTMRGMFLPRKPLCMRVLTVLCVISLTAAATMATTTSSSKHNTGSPSVGDGFGEGNGGGGSADDYVYEVVRSELLLALQQLPGMTALTDTGSDNDSNKSKPDELIAVLKDVVKLVGEKGGAAGRLDMDLRDFASWPLRIQQDLTATQQQQQQQQDGFQPLCSPQQELMQSLELFRQYLGAAESLDREAEARAQGVVSQLHRLSNTQLNNDNIHDAHGAEGGQKTLEVMLQLMQALAKPGAPLEETGGLDSIRLRDIKLPLLSGEESSSPPRTSDSIKPAAVPGRIEFAVPSDAPHAALAADGTNNVAAQMRPEASWSALVDAWLPASQGAEYVSYVLEGLCAVLILAGIIYAVGWSVSVQSGDLELGMDDTMASAPATKGSGLVLQHAADAASGNKENLNGVLKKPQKASPPPGKRGPSHSAGLDASEFDPQISVLAGPKPKAKKVRPNRKPHRQDRTLSDFSGRGDEASSDERVVLRKRRTKGGSPRNAVAVLGDDEVRGGPGSAADDDATQDLHATADADASDDDITLEDAAVLLRHKPKGLVNLLTQAAHSKQHTTANDVPTIGILSLGSDDVSADAEDRSGFQKPSRRGGRKKTGSAHGHEEIFLSSGDVPLVSTTSSDEVLRGVLVDTTNVSGSEKGSVDEPEPVPSEADGEETGLSFDASGDGHVVSSDNEGPATIVPVAEAVDTMPVALDHIADAGAVGAMSDPPGQVTAREVSGATIALSANGEAVDGTPVIPKIPSNASLPSMSWATEPDARLTSSLFPGHVVAPSHQSFISNPTPGIRARANPVQHRPPMHHEYLSLIYDRRYDEITRRLDYFARGGDPASLHALNLIAQKVDVPLALIYAEIIPPESLGYSRSFKGSRPTRMAPPTHYQNTLYSSPDRFGMQLDHSIRTSPYGDSIADSRSLRGPSGYHVSPQQQLAGSHSPLDPLPINRGSPAVYAALSSGFVVPGAAPLSATPHSDGYPTAATAFPSPEHWAGPHTSSYFSTPEALEPSRVQTPTDPSGEIMTSLGLPLYLGALGTASPAPAPAPAPTSTSSPLEKHQAPGSEPLIRGHHRNHSGGETVLIPAGDAKERRSFLLSPDLGAGHRDSGYLR